MEKFFQILLICSVLLLPIISYSAVKPSPLMHAKVFQEYHVAENYWLTEKFDGVRAYWDGTKLWTRSGYQIDVPDWFSSAMPSLPLDGELWIGYNKFSDLVSLVQQANPDDERWRQVTLMVFDLPIEGQIPYEQRQIRLATVSADWPHWLQMIPSIKLRSADHLQQLYSQVITRGGEGIMLNLEGSAYTSQRTNSLLKKKPVNDAEATVIGYKPGKGRLAGKTGSLRVKTAEGVEFYLGSGLDDELRTNPPKIGSLVTYEYNGLTRHGKPRFPRYKALRDQRL